MVAIVGATGSGKSTLARLMLGLFPADAGQVLLDETPMEERDLRILRSNCGIVAQDSVLCGGTILDNLTMYTPDASIDQVVDAAKIACVHGDIMRLPMGYHTPPGERGRGLSGGRLQRLAIARAVVRSPRLLVLDEATSHLDTITEQRVHENLDRLRCARIVISHRLSSIRHADHIIVMDGGAITQAGTQHELVSTAGAYRDLAQAQGADWTRQADRTNQRGALNASGWAHQVCGPRPSPIG
ncbi:ATP-binding cassette domain-containing protein [Amycolatopsis sp. lyj-108]|uniref:ATP-binding cassette domain-containing protein n=1 Tax=Amycolatopsis sp. lyj-108 TaxID=2789286 RepID=UPI00397AB2CF